MSATSQHLADKAHRQKVTGTGGKFGELTRQPPGSLSLDTLESPQPEIVELEDNWGDAAEITPGELNDEADWIYTNGQCLALAVQIHERTGWPIVVHTIEDPAEELDDDGEEIMWESVRHAYVQRPDGVLIDIRGAHDQDAIELDEGEAWRVCDTATEARMRYEDFMAEQDYETADSFVCAALEHH